MVAEQMNYLIIFKEKEKDLVIDSNSINSL